MPVGRLLLEGKLDVEVWTGLLAGRPLVDTRHSAKGSLPPRCRDLRHDQSVTACYVRDRDFDSEPPADLTRPTVDKADAGAALGWRWCRHAIESYLIDPSVIHAALGWDQPGYTAELVRAAHSVRHYQAARWVVGQARHVLPPHKDFPTQPTECHGHEFKLPTNLTAAAATAWFQTQAASFTTGVQATLGAAELNARFAHYDAHLTDTFLGDVANVLHWCSGKDLLAGLMPWLQATHKIHPSQLRNRVRDWMTANTDQTFALLPEWDAFRTLLRSYP